MRITAIAFCALLVAASPAAAQPWGVYGPGGYAPAISIYEVHATLRASGMRPVSPPVRSGSYILVRAVDPHGDLVRVVLDGRWGNIVTVAPLPPAPIVGEGYRPFPPASNEPYPPYGAVRPDLKTEPAGTVAPNDAFGAHAAQQRQPPKVGSVPMPRARPAIPAATAAVNRPKVVTEAPSVAPPPPPVAPAPPAASTEGAAAPAAAPSFPPAAPLE